MPRTGFVFAILLACLGLFSPPGIAVESDRQVHNLVFVLTDDLDVTSFRALLDVGLLPNIQELLEQGVTFENAFVTNAICCPSRATSLTGLYSHNHRIFSNHGPHPTEASASILWPGWFPSQGTPGLNESTVAVALQKAGYYTGLVGKYLGGYGRYAPEGVADPKTYIPPGWDEWYGLLSPGTYQMYDYEMNRNGTTVQFGDSQEEYQTDVLADQMVVFIEQSAQLPQPFFLYLSPVAPHVELLDPLQPILHPTGEYRKLFGASIRPANRHLHMADGDPANGEVPVLVPKPSFNEDVLDKPVCPAEKPPPDGVPSLDVIPDCPGDLLPLREDEDIPALEEQYKMRLASMLAVDDLVGRLMDTLAEHQLVDNTVVVFTSDNGWFNGEHRLSNKELAYEESIRVPLVIRAPGVDPGRSGHLVINNDIAPTLAELGGTALSLDVDGSSLVPLLEDPAGATWRRKRFLIEHWFIPSLIHVQFATYKAMRGLESDRDYLYVVWDAPASLDGTANGAVEYYDLEVDPYQLDNQTLPEGVSDYLRENLDALSRCQGSGCRILEAIPLAVP